MRKLMLIGASLVALAGASAAGAQTAPVQERSARSLADQRATAQAVIDQAVAEGRDVAAAVAAALVAEPDLAPAFAEIARANAKLASAIQAGLKTALTQLAQSNGQNDPSPFIPYVSSAGFGGGVVSPH